MRSARRFARRNGNFPTGASWARVGSPRSNKLNCHANGGQTGLGGVQKPARIPLPMGEKKPYPRGDLGATAMKSARAGKAPKVLVIDTGGTNIKLLATGQRAAQISLRSHHDGGEN